MPPWLALLVLIAATVMLPSKLLHGFALGKALVGSPNPLNGGVQTVVESTLPPLPVKDVIVQLFQWSWDAVVAECKDYLGPMGYGFVQVSPPQETIQGPQWWTDYQPVSYKRLGGKHGDRDGFERMVRTCREAGVGVVADVVLNPMTAGSGTGTAGSIYSKYEYPDGFNRSTFHHCHNGRGDSIHDYFNATEVQECELLGLADHDTAHPFVQQALAEYLRHLVSLGVSGFRVDAAKHMAVDSLGEILRRVSPHVYIVQEVIYGRGEPITPAQYQHLGDVFVFQGARDLKRMFLSDDIRFLLQPIRWGSGWGDGYLKSETAAVFVANHDTERDGSTLRWDSPRNAYVLATIFLLGWDYGSPSVFSGWNYVHVDDGAPHQKCDEHGGGFRCEHRWQAISNMVRFHNAVGSTPVERVTQGGPHQIGFSRGNVGYLLLNNGGSDWRGTWTTGLPPGRYCDIIHDTDFTPGRCASDFYEVGEDGAFSGTVKPYDALVLYIWAR